MSGHAAGVLQLCVAASVPRKPPLSGLGTAACARNPAPPVCGRTGGGAAFSDAEKEELKRAIFENPGRFNGMSKHGVNWNAIIRRCMAGDYTLLQRRVKPGTKVLSKLYVRMLRNGETTARVPPAEPASSSEDAGGV